MYKRQIITTALIPGKPAPKLITADMVKSMKPGSVIVDMAAERGGNCELTEPGQSVVKHGVTIVGYTDLASRLAKQASTLYSTNLFRLTEELCKTKDGIVNVNMEDDAIRGLTVTKEGNITGPPPAPKLPAAAPSAAAKPATAPAAKKAHGHGAASAPMAGSKLAIMFGVAALLFWFVGASAPKEFLPHFTVFVPVSYTHLDVYKRQHHGRLSKRRHRHDAQGHGKPVGSNGLTVWCTRSDDATTQADFSVVHHGRLPWCDGPLGS